MIALGGKNLGTSFGIETTKTGKEHLVVKVSVSKIELINLRYCSIFCY